MMDKAISLTDDDIKRAAVKADRVDMGPTASGVLVMDEAAAPLMEGVLNTDGYLHIHKDDVLAIGYDIGIDRATKEEIEKYLGEKLRAKVVVLDRGSKILGVIRHGDGAKC